MYTAPSTLPLDGACRCGAVRMRITKPPIMTSVCHCTGCQSMSSSAYSLTAMIPADGFEIIQGEPVPAGMHAPDLRHMGCPRCLSWMFTRVQGAPFVNVRPTLLEDTRWFRPFLETMTREALPWVSTPAVRRYDGFPPMDEFAELLEAYQTTPGA